nr:probable 2-oxoglutarate-dependent dioxygenase AOP1 [Tanacetum cinerariifolium]
MVKKMVFEGLNLRKYLEKHLEETSYHLKVMKYRVADPSEPTMGLANSFVVMAGESFNVLSNGRLHAPFHRVVMNANKTRLSVG